MRRVGVLAAAIIVVAAPAAIGRDHARVDQCPPPGSLKLVRTMTLTVPGGSASFSLARGEIYRAVFSGYLRLETSTGPIDYPVWRAPSPFSVNGGPPPFQANVRAANPEKDPSAIGVWMQIAHDGKSIFTNPFGPSKLPAPGDPSLCAKVIPYTRSLPGTTLEVKHDPKENSGLKGTVKIEVYQLVRPGKPPTSLPKERYVFGFTAGSNIHKATARAGEERHYAHAGGSGEITVGGSGDVGVVGSASESGIYVRDGKVSIRTVQFRLESATVPSGGSVSLGVVVTASTQENCPKVGDRLMFELRDTGTKVGGGDTVRLTGSCVNDSFVNVLNAAVAGVSIERVGG